MIILHVQCVRVWQVDIRRVNPYQAAIYVIGRSLAAFDDDHLIPTFGFGVL